MTGGGRRGGSPCGVPSVDKGGLVGSVGYMLRTATSGLEAAVVYRSGVHPNYMHPSAVPSV